MSKLKDFVSKNLPSKEELASNKYLSKFCTALEDPQVWCFDRKSVSKGVGAGVFAAFIPMPFQMLIACILALYLRGNILCAIACTWITNPITFIPIKIFLYKVGQQITGVTFEYEHSYYFEWGGKSISEILTLLWGWLTTVGEALIVAIPIVAFTAGCFAYLTINAIWLCITYIKKLFR